MLENTYGFVKRLDFISKVIRSSKPRRVLDLGCGTGENLTRPLATFFPEIEFVAVDSDTTSIEFAKRENTANNASYLHQSEALNLGDFDLVIASEVLEHVELPDAFLNDIRAKLSRDGLAIITIPNGYGPFEWASFLESLWFFCGGYYFVHAVRPRDHMVSQDSAVADTLAVSPHINFFGYRQVLSMFKSAGFRVENFQSRTFLCGFGFDHVMRSARIVAWNCKIADRLSPRLASAWMFVLRPTQPIISPPYMRNLYARIRRYLNERRWGVR